MNKHEGSSFDDFLREEGILDEVMEAAMTKLSELKKRWMTDPEFAHWYKVDGTPERLWTAAELAIFLGLSVATVEDTARRKPDRLPPRVRAMRLLRWSPTVCHDWAVRESGKIRKPGRPRKPI